MLSSEEEGSGRGQGESNLKIMAWITEQMVTPPIWLDGGGGEMMSWV